MKTVCYKLMVALVLLVILSLNSYAFAGTGQDLVMTNSTSASLILSEPVVWLYNFMKGTGGLLIALISLTCALYSAIVTKSLMGVFVSLSVEILSHFFIDALFTFFGATI